MNTVAHQRLLNTLLGLLMFIVGLGFFGAASYVYKHPPSPAGAAPLVQGDALTCEQTLSRLGHRVRREGNVLRVERNVTTFNDAKTMLSNASLGISACGFPLLQFCMGPGCSMHGLSFSLSTEIPASFSHTP